MQYGVDAALAAGTIMAVAAAAMTMSSPQGAFSMINQFQLLLLLPMIPKYLPSDALLFIMGMDFTMFSFDFIPFDRLPMVSSISEWLDYDQDEQYLTGIGMRSGSAVINQIKLLCLVCFVAFLHICYFPVYKLADSLEETNKCRKLTTKIFKFLTFAVYIRLMLEAYLFALLSIVSEIYHMNTSAFVNTVSLVLSFIYAGILV